MRIFTTLDSIAADSFPRGSAVAIGKFDGMHLGHQAVFDRLTSVGEQHGLERIVFTFARNPLEFLRPELGPQPLGSRERRLELFEHFGADSCVMIDFDADFAGLSPEEYVDEVLVGRLNAKHVIVGHDFRFGSKGLGDVALLQRLGGTRGIEIDVVEPVEIPGIGRVSSTKVRESFSRGDVALTARMLGRPGRVAGEVVHGDARGRTLGFPTANLGGDVSRIVPGDGVYAGWALVDGEHRYRAAVSIGSNPTFTPEVSSRVEAHLLDFSGDIYGAKIEVYFIERLRGTVKFSGVDELVERMEQDVEEARAILTEETAAALPA